jgi:four helix bundle protein
VHDRARIPTLPAYAHALGFLHTADVLARRLPRNREYMKDQLRRAALSIALNIAEGAGEFRPREKARFYRMARRSACECRALYDAVEALDLVDLQDLAPGREQLDELVGQLTRLALAVERRDSDGPPGLTGRRDPRRRR